MSIVIKGITSTGLKIDPTSKALRSTLYKSNGEVLTVFDTVDSCPNDYIGYYSYTLSTAGVASANVFLSLFNPNGSGRIFEIKDTKYSSFCVAQVVTKISKRLSRISSSTGGTDSSGNITKVDTQFRGSMAVVRTGNPTVLQIGDIMSYPPPIEIAGSAAYAFCSREIENEDLDLVLREGEGVSIYQTGVGDVDEVLIFRLNWEEYQIE